MVRILIKGGVWKNSEDEILKAAVMKYGKNHWARVASLLARKSAKQCKARWHEWLDPSIKKTEWTREEDEKLLHLAKLMPTQWRTIAPAVGRTAAQCLERYEKLLDMAQDDTAEGDEDVRKLKIGEIDPNPETKPARPDPIDMDEDEKEMLSEARARLANTRGKKAKRRARERQLENARRLASMQKFRELKASGIHASSHKLGIRRKKGEIDYNNEIPFEKPAPAGFYDVTKEREIAERKSMDPEERAKMLKEMNKRARANTFDEDKVRKRAKKNFDQLAKDNLPAALERINEANDPSNARVRSKLALPTPQVSDAELQEIAAGGREAISVSKGDRSTQGLLGEYKRPSTLAKTVTARTPVAPDSVMQEARNQVQRINAQTPLMGGKSTALADGTGFRGSTPATQAPSTASVASVATVGLATPLRDELSINNDAADEFLDEATELGRLQKQQRKEQKEKLLKGFSALPKPEDSYEILVKFQDDQFDQEGNMTVQPDAEDLEAERLKLQKEKEQEELKKRTLAVQRNLPRPCPTNDHLKYFDASELIKQELLLLLKHDAINHPMPTKKKQKLLQQSTIKLTSVDEMENARMLIAAEVAQSKLQNPSLEAFNTYLDDLHSGLQQLTSGEIKHASETKENEKLDGVKVQFKQLMTQLKTLSKQLSKEEKKARTLTKGFEIRANKAAEELSTVAQQTQDSAITLQVYGEIRSHEATKLNERLQRAHKEVEAVVEVEAELQKKYSSLR